MCTKKFWICWKTNWMPDMTLPQWSPHSLGSLPCLSHVIISDLFYVRRGLIQEYGTSSFNNKSTHPISSVFCRPVSYSEIFPGADPGFPIGGGANPPGGGANLRFCQKFPKKLHEIEKILGRRGEGAPLISLVNVIKNTIQIPQRTRIYG